MKVVKSLYKIEDFVDIEENLSPYDVNDLVHICKRVNNTKREYLFVNRYQGKHIPEDPFKIEKLFRTFFNVVRGNLDFNERIVVVGFAETATALAQYITVSLNLDSLFRNSIKYHLQTTRENLNCPKLIDFSEEHSHATNQYLYCSDLDALKDGSFDRILFVEDEITTGKTILNFIAEFRKINPNCKYSVASILNWQNDENRKIFEENDIDRIYLVSGKIKENLPKIDIDSVEILDYFNNQEKVDSKAKIIDLGYNHKATQNIGRSGIKPSDLAFLVGNVTDNIEIQLSDFITSEDNIMVIGTEEFMYVPMYFAREIQPDCGCEVKYRATTRSPIMASSEKGYIITDGITLPSAYEEGRQTYLYNMRGNYNKIIVITDGIMTEGFVNALCSFSEKNGKEIIFVKV